MIPRYATILDKHIQSITKWKSPMMHIVHHILLTVIRAKDYYTLYANGQPLHWLIDCIVSIINGPSFRKKVHRKEQTPEFILINSALRTLSTFVHEPDLLIYIKQLKLSSILRPLTALPYESIVIHTYLLLAYILDEDDIKVSEKDSGRLLTKIFDLLRTNLTALSRESKNNQILEHNLGLLIETLQGN